MSKDPEALLEQKLEALEGSVEDLRNELVLNLVNQSTAITRRQNQLEERLNNVEIRVNELKKTK